MHFVRGNLIMATGSQTSLEKKNPPEEIHGLKVIKKHMTAILLGSFAIK